MSSRIFCSVNRLRFWPIQVSVEPWSILTVVDCIRNSGGSGSLETDAFRVYDESLSVQS